MEIVQLGPKARSPDIPDLVKHCVRSHTEYTRQHQSTDVKVGDNSTTRTLRFGKETTDQAIQQGNARPLKPPRYRKGNHGAPSQQKHVLKCTAAMVSNTSKNSRQAINPGCLVGIIPCNNSNSQLGSPQGHPSSYGNGELQLKFREKGPQTADSRHREKMVETKRVSNSLGISLVSPQTPEQLGPNPDYDNQLTTDWLGSPDIPDLVKHCDRSHTECTRQYQSTDVKVWDNSPARTLSFGKETAVQAIQQGNARARNEAFDRHYKAICVAGKSEGIEALKQDTDLNIAFERKSVVWIQCIWVFSMTCTRSQGLQGPSYGNGELQLKFREKGPQTGITVAVVIQPLKPAWPEMENL
ncbi:hypothetical protein R3P38DRAFT_2816304 [Favolaschia claudopus]|uniref:Uncharacterized protein n=1 Tax=Favolaschia claudopus TaxID=2862362 RepID=A0AAV9YZB0_9AGAR